MAVSKRIKLPADLWAPLFERCRYPLVLPSTHMTDYIAYGVRHRRACERYYGDNRVDHIQPLKET